MLANIALFELRYQLRRPIALVTFLIFGAFALAVVAIQAGDRVGPVPVNSAWRMIITFGLFTIYGMFLSLATLADVALRDRASRMDEIMRTQPIWTPSYLGAKFAGAYVVASLAALGMVFGHLLGCYMPWVNPAAIGIFRPAAYAVAFAVMVLPSLFATGALFFMVAKLTRSLMATYLSAILLLILFIAIPFVLVKPEWRTLAALLDPFGLYAFIFDTAQWSSFEQATRLVPLDGLFIWNRLLWIGIGCVLLTLSFVFFNNRERRPWVRVSEPKRAAPLVVRERPVIARGGAGMWEQLKVRTGHEAKAIFRTWTFIILTVLGVLMVSTVLLVQILLGAMPSPPPTARVADTIASAIWLIALLVPIAYGGELLWRDRRAKIAEIIDSSATPNVVFLMSKVAGVGFVILAILAAAMITGLLIQVRYGTTDFHLGFYAIKLGLEVGLPALMFSVLAILIQTVVNRKFIGLLLMLTALGVLGVVAEYGVDNKLLLPFHIPPVQLLEPRLLWDFLSRALLFAGYWTSVTVLIATIAYLLWVRGTGSLLTRIRRVPHAMTPAVIAVVCLALCGAVAAGGYIMWSAEAFLGPASNL